MDEHTVTQAAWDAWVAELRQEREAMGPEDLQAQVDLTNEIVTELLAEEKETP